MTTPEEYREIAEKIRSGEYFREARTMYDVEVHDPMAERYFYIFITLVSLLIFAISFVAMRSLYPLNRAVPFIVGTTDIVEDIPHIKTLLKQAEDSPDEAVLRFLVQNYVIFREEYSIANFDRDISGVKGQSSDVVFKEFQQYIDPHNAESPITLYQRHSSRRIEVISSKRLTGGEFNMEVVFDAIVESKTEIKKTRMVANIAFNYGGVKIDEETGRMQPLNFVVTRYQTKRL